MRQAHPNSLANLRPFRPGQSGNPAGRRSAGAHVREWENSMVSWPLEKIRAVLTHPSAPTAKRIAAQVLLDAAEGKMPAIAELCDRTEGRPTQRIELERLGPSMVQIVLPSLPLDMLVAMSRLAGDERITAPQLPVAATQSDDPASL